MSIEQGMPSNHLILCCPLLLLPSIFPIIRIFSNESALHIRWPKYWSFSFNIRPSNEHPGLISFRMDWLHLFAVQGTLNSLLQPHSSKPSILQHSAFFIVQLSHPYMITGKCIALTRWIFFGRVMSLLFNMLSQFCSVQFSLSVMSNSSWPYELQHARPPCPSATPEVHSNSCPSSWWCHPAISSSVVPFYSCPQSLPAPESFPMSKLMRWPKYWSFSFSIIPSKEIQGLISFRMDWLDLLAVQVTLKSLLQHHSSKPSILQHSAFFTVQLSHPYMTTGKTRALTRWTLVGKVMSLLLNMLSMLSRLIITFLPRSKRLLIS